MKETVISSHCGGATSGNRNRVLPACRTFTAVGMLRSPFDGDSPFSSLSPSFHSRNVGFDLVRGGFSHRPHLSNAGKPQQDRSVEQQHERKEKKKKRERRFDPRESFAEVEEPCVRLS